MNIRGLLLPFSILLLIYCGPTNKAVTPEGEKRWAEMKYLDKHVGRGALDFPTGHITVQGRDNVYLVWDMGAKDFEYFEAPRNAAAIQEIIARARAVGFRRLDIRVDDNIRRIISIRPTSKKMNVFKIFSLRRRYRAHIFEHIQKTFVQESKGGRI